MGHYLDRTDERCQPCEHFTDDGDPYNVHECLAPFEPGPKCGGLVSFCDNCNSDHHHGGYNRCEGAASCRFGHPACKIALGRSCECYKCLNDPSLGIRNPVLQRMVLCAVCGNKRCPRATWHENECTGSNEPGQPESRY